VARMIGQADQKVGRDSFVRFDDLLKEMTAIKAELAKLGILVSRVSDSGH